MMRLLKHYLLHPRHRTGGRNVNRYALNRLLAFLLLAGTMLLALPHPAYACSCVGTASVEEARTVASTVFAGEVVDVDKTLFDLPWQREPRETRVTLRVSQVWKGETPQEVVLTTAADTASCGFPFNRGETYLVYGWQTDSGLTTGLCSRTTQLANASEDLGILGTGEPPAPGSAASTTAPILLFAALLALVVVAIPALYLYRRTRSNTGA